MGVSTIMQRVRVSTADGLGHESRLSNTTVDVEDGFVIRGVHKQEPGSMVSKDTALCQSFTGMPAPIYRPRPRPHHLAKESTEARIAESRRWSHAAYGLSRFRVTAQLARIAAQNKLGGQRRTSAAGGNPLIAKKWKEVGRMLKHTAGGVTRIRSLVDRDKRTYLAAAQEALRLAAVGVLDVKLSVRSEQELQSLSYLHQGDASMYTPEVMAERMAIKATSAFREAVMEWWKWLPLSTLPLEERMTEDEKIMPADMRGMTKPVYCAMAALIQRVLLPRFGLKPNPSYEPEEDWVFDCRGKRFLLFPQLLHALFELADMWTPTVSEVDYVTLLDELLEQCKALEGRHGLFSKLLLKFQRRYGAREEGALSISGGYVAHFDAETAKAGALAPAGAAGDGAAVPAGGGAEGSGDLGRKGGAKGGLDEADLILKALSDDEDDEDHRAATNWWAKIMERNRRFVQAKAKGMADLVAEAAAATVTAAAATSGSRPTSPLPFPMAVLGSLYVSPENTDSGEAAAAGATARRPVPPPTELKPGPGALLRMGKGLKGQAAPAPSAALVATLREAVTDALVEVGASADAKQAETVLTEDGTIAYQQLGPHTLAEVLHVLVDLKRMNTRHIRALIGTSNKSLLGPKAGISSKSLLSTTGGSGEPGCVSTNGAVGGDAIRGPGGGGGGGGGGSQPGSRVVSRRKIQLPTIFDAAGGEGDDEADGASPPRAGVVLVGAVGAAGPASTMSSRKNLLGGASQRSLAAGSPTGSVAADAAVGGLGGDDSNGKGDGGGEDNYNDDVANRPGPQLFAARPRTPSMDPATLCAIRAALQGAGMVSGDLSGMLAAHGMGLATDVQPRALVEVAKVLAGAGFSTEHIVAFLFPPEGEDGITFLEPLSEVQLEAMKVALSKAGVTADMVELVRSWTADMRTIQTTSAALEASGFTPLEVQRFIAPAASTALVDALRRRGINPAAAASMMRRDGTGLSLELSPKELAEAADAMAVAGFSASQVIKAIGSDAASVPPLEPAGLDACREALLSNGFTEEELDEVVLTDNGTALQDGVGAATMARVVGSLAIGGISSETIRRFLRYDIVRASKCALSQQDITAMHAAISGAGLMSSPDDDPPEDAPLLPDGSGVAPIVGAGVVAQIGGALVDAMFNPAQIRAFLMPDPEGDQGKGQGGQGGQAAAAAAASEAPAPGLLDQEEEGQERPAAGRRRRYLSPREVVVFRSVLMASGFGTQELMDLVRLDGRGLDPDADPELAAKAVAALSAAGFKGHEIQLFLQLRDPAPVLTPAEAAAARAALVTAGFGPRELERMLRRDGMGLMVEPEPEPYVMAQVAVVLAEAGFPSYHICQYLSPALPLVPVMVLAVGRYFSHGVSGRIMRPASQAPSTNPWGVLPEDGRLLPEDDVSDDEEDARAEEEAAAAAAEAAAEARQRREEEEEAAADAGGGTADATAPAASGEEGEQEEVPGLGAGQLAGTGDGDGEERPTTGRKRGVLVKEGCQTTRVAGGGGAGGDGAAVAARAEGLTSRLALPPGMQASMQETVSRRCKGLNAKQMRQMAAQMAEPGPAAAAAAAGAGGGGGSWLPLEADVTARVVRALSYEGFAPDEIRRFFMQPALAAADANRAAGGDVIGGAGELLFDHIPPPLLFLIRALLKAAGFTDQHLSNMLSSDRRRLDPDWDPESAAMMVAAMARAGWSPQLIRLMLVTGPPVPALTPNELGTINEALLEAGFSRRQLRLVLRHDHSGPGRGIDVTTLAQMATAMAQAGCSAGHICQFLGPLPASFSKSVPLPLLTPLLAAINGNQQQHQQQPPALPSATASAGGTGGGGTAAPAAGAAAPAGLAATGTSAGLIINASSVGAGSLPAAGPAGGLMAASGTAPAAGIGGGVTGSSLDSRSVMDIRNVAASCGISSRTLADMIRPDGKGLQPGADPRVIERVGLHMVNQGFTPPQVYRFLLPHGGCEYGRFDPPTCAAVRAVLLAAGFTPGDLKTLLTSSNSVVAPAVASPTLAAIAYCLAASGATADQIRQFLRPPPGAAPTDTSATTVAEVILGGLMASGYEDNQLDLILRRDGTALRANVGPLRLAQMVAALAAAEVPASTIRMFVRPLGGVRPTVALMLKAALEQSPGFDHERVEAAFSPETFELGPRIEPCTLADIATALTSVGVAPDVIRQLISLPPAPGPAAAAAAAAAAAPLVAAGGSSGELAFPFPPNMMGSGAAPPPGAEASQALTQPSVGAALRGRLCIGGPGGGLHPSLPFTKMLAMREAVAARSDTNNPAELLDMHDPAKVVLALADAGYPSEDIRAFISSDPKAIAAPAVRGPGPMIGGTSAAGGNGFVAAVLARNNAILGPMMPMRMSDPGIARSNTKVRQNGPSLDRSTSRLPALGLLPAGSIPGPRITVDGTEASSPTRAPPRMRTSHPGWIVQEQQQHGTGSWPDFEYRAGEAAGTAAAVAAAAAQPPLSAEHLLAWLVGVRQPDGGPADRLPPGLETQFATYLRRLLVRLVGNDTLRAAAAAATAGTSVAADAAAAAADANGGGLPDGDGAAAAVPHDKVGGAAGTAAVAKISKSRALVKLMALLLRRLLTRIRGGSPAGPLYAWQQAAGDGSGDTATDAAAGATGGEYGSTSANAACSLTVSTILSALVHRTPGAAAGGGAGGSGGGGGGGLPPGLVAPSLLRYMVVSAVRLGLYSEADAPDIPSPAPRPAPPPGPAPGPETSVASSVSRLGSQGPGERRPDPGHLRPLPAGYARAWGETATVNRRLVQPGSPSAATAAAAAAIGPSLLYRPLAQRTNPSLAAVKAGSPRETLPLWPLQRAFVHPAAATSPAWAPPTSRLHGEAPGSPSAASPSSPHYRPSAGGGANGHYTGSSNGSGSPQLHAYSPHQYSHPHTHPHAHPHPPPHPPIPLQNSYQRGTASQDGTGAGSAAGSGGGAGVVLPPARPGGAASQPASPRASSGWSSSLNPNSVPRRPSSSGALAGGGGGSGEAGDDAAGVVMLRLPALLTRSASSGRVFEEQSSSPGPLPAPAPTHAATALISPNLRRSLRDVIGGGSSGGGAAAGTEQAATTAAGQFQGQGLGAGQGQQAGGSGPSPEALFVRLLAELLRWLEAPVDDPDGSSGGRRGAMGGWQAQAWLAAQKVRLSSQLAHLGKPGGAGPGLQLRDQMQRPRPPALAPPQELAEEQEEAPRAEEAAESVEVEPPRRTSDPGTTFLITQHAAGLEPWQPEGS